MSTSGNKISKLGEKHNVLPARKHHQPRHQEDQSEDDKQRVTRPPPAGVVKHLGRLSEEKVHISYQ